MENELTNLNRYEKKISKEVRSKEIDIIKGFACMGVIYIHYSFHDLMGDFLQEINRYAISFFFFVSGFFFLDSNLSISNNRIIRKIKHILLLLRNSGIFYFIYTIIFYFIKDKNWNIIAFTQNLMNKEKIIKFFLFNHPFLYPHLWFSMSLLYCYLFMLLLNCLRINIIQNLAFEIIITCFCLFSYHSLTEFGNLKLINIFLSRINLKRNNSALFLFRAFPFFMSGIIIKKTKFKQFKSNLLIFIFIIGSFIVCFEKSFFKISLNSYFGTYIQLISIISFCHKCGNYSNKLIGLISYIGRELSDKIYIYHVAVGNTINFICLKYGLYYKAWYFYFRFVLVLPTSIIFTYFLNFINNIKIDKGKLIAL